MNRSDWKRPFFTVWMGQQLSLVGSQVAQFALVWWLTETTGSAAVLGSATAVAMLPGVFLSPFAGALVDHWSRRTVMIVADGLIAIVVAWVVLLFWTETIRIWHVYVLMTARAVGMLFSGSFADLIGIRELYLAAGVIQIIVVGGASLVPSISHLGERTMAEEARELDVMRDM